MFVVITFAMMTIGRSLAMIPGYAKAKEAATKIMRLHNRQAKINPHDDSGIILVFILISMILVAFTNFVSHI